MHRHRHITRKPTALLSPFFFLLLSTFAVCQSPPPPAGDAQTLIADAIKVSSSFLSLQSTTTITPSFFRLLSRSPPVPPGGLQMQYVAYSPTCNDTLGDLPPLGTPFFNGFPFIVVVRADTCADLGGSGTLVAALPVLLSLDTVAAVILTNPAFPTSLDDIITSATWTTAAALRGPMMFSPSKLQGLSNGTLAPTALNNISSPVQKPLFWVDSSVANSIAYRYSLFGVSTQTRSPDGYVILVTAGGKSIGAVSDQYRTTIVTNVVVVFGVLVVGSIVYFWIARRRRVMLIRQLARLSTLRTTHPALYASLVHNTVLDRDSRTVDPRVLKAPECDAWTWGEGPPKGKSTGHSVARAGVAAPAPVAGAEEDTDTASCPICLDPYTPTTLMRTLPCGHAYHQTCVDEWLTTKRGVCPVCREDYTPEGEWVRDRWGVGGTAVDGEGEGVEEARGRGIGCVRVPTWLSRLGGARRQMRRTVTTEQEMTLMASRRQEGDGEMAVVAGTPPALVGENPSTVVVQQSADAVDNSDLAPAPAPPPTGNASISGTTTTTPQGPSLPPLPSPASIPNPNRLLYVLHRRIIRERARRSTLSSLAPDLENNLDADLNRELDEWEAELARWDGGVRSLLGGTQARVRGAVAQGWMGRMGAGVAA